MTHPHTNDQVSIGMALECCRGETLGRPNAVLDARQIVQLVGKRRHLAQPWEQVIAEDFAGLRKAGMTNSLMPKIERALGMHSK